MRGSALTVFAVVAAALVVVSNAECLAQGTVLLEERFDTLELAATQSTFGERSQSSVTFFSAHL